MTIFKLAEVNMELKSTIYLLFILHRDAFSQSNQSIKFCSTFLNE